MEDPDLEEQAPFPGTSQLLPPSNLHHPHQYGRGESPKHREGQYSGLSNGPQVSFVAHIGGGVAGMTIGYVFFSCYDKKLLKDPRFWLCIVGYVVFILFAVLFNIFLSPAP